MKRLAVVALLLLGLTGAALVAAKLYLSSASAARQVASSLESLLGLPVTVESASIGLAAGSDLRGLRITEGDDAVLTVDRVETDLTALAALTGKLPRQLTLTGVQLTLRFDKSGKLLTRLPDVGGDGNNTPLPRIELRDVRITLAQEGKPPLVVRGDRLEVSSENGRVSLQGRLDDETWGEWDVSGGFESGTVTLEIAAKDLSVTPKKLADLPFVPAVVWEQVSLEGRTSARLTLRLDASDNTLHYRVEAAPRDAKVRVTAIDLDARDTSGEVVVEDGRVWLKRVKGQAAGGTIAADADLDFRNPGADMAFRVSVKGLSVAKLPRAWQLPIDSGRLSGSANLTLKVRDGKLQTGGEGKGTIDGVEFAGGTGTIGLRLHGDGRRFRFRGGEGVSALSEPRTDGDEPSGVRQCSVALPLLFFVLAEAGRGETKAAERQSTAALQTKGRTPNPAALVSWLTGAAGDAISALGRGTNRALRNSAAFVAKVGAAPAPGEAPTYLEANLSFQDVQLKQLIDRVGVALPFPVEGRLSFALKIEAPVNTPRDLKAYRLQGTIDVATLQLAGLAFESVKARLDYRDGALVLEELTGRLPAKPTPGSFSGKARLQVVPLGDLALRLEIDGFDLATLSRLPADYKPPLLLGGKARLDVTANGPLRLQAIEAKGAVRVTDLVVEKLPLGAAEVRYSLQKAILAIDIVRARFYDGEVAGSVSLPLRLDDPGEVNLTLKSLDVARAARALANMTLPVQGRLSGTVKGSLTAAKADQPRGIRAIVDVTAPQLRIQNVPAERVRGNLRYLEGRVEYELEADALGGKVRIDGRLPPARRPKGGTSGARFGSGRFRVLLARVEADDLLGDLAGLKGYVSGSLDAELRGVSDGEWYGGGVATLTRGEAFGVAVTDWRLPLSFRLAPMYGRGELTVSDSSAQAAQGRLSLRGSISWAAEGARLEGNLRLVEARLSGLAAGLGSYAEGRVTGRVEFSGENVRSASDLRGNVQATLEGGRAQQLPVFAQLAPYLAPAGRSAAFRDGRLEARLSNGVVRVQKLELNGDVLDLFAQGAVTLRGGLDLSVTARTEALAGNPVLLRLLALQVPAIGPVPVAVLVRISALLANRVIHLRVAGTIAHPQVRVEPLRLLTDEAVRYFLTRLLLAS